MRRRTVLALCGASLAGVAGCSDSDAPSPSTETPTQTQSPEPSTAFEFVEVSAPAEVGVATPYEFDARVRNTTEESRRFASRLSLRVDGGEWHTFEREVTAEIGAGSVGTVSAGLGVLPFLNTYEVRLDALGATWTVRAVPERLGFGKSYTTPRGVSITALGGRFEESYSSAGNETAAQTPEPGTRWVIVLLELKNATDTERRTPALGTFVLEAGGEQYTTRVADPTQRLALGTGETTRVELPYVVPEETTASEIAVRWRQEYNRGSVAVVWTESSG